MFSNSIKVNYTWCERGRYNIAYNSWFTGLIAFIYAITSHGDWFNFSLNTRNNSGTFTDIIQELIKWLTVDLEIDQRRIVLMLGNSPIHTLKNSMNFLKKQNAKLYLMLSIVLNLLPSSSCFISLREGYVSNQKDR